MSYDKYKIYNGKSISDLSKETGIKASTIAYRLRKGWKLEDAISTKSTNGGSLAKTKYDIIGKIFKDRFGNEFIVEGLNCRRNNVAYYNVKFLKSGYETVACSSHIRGINGRYVQDRLSPSVFGVGVLGFAYTSNNQKLFDVWRAMIARCYNPNNPSYKTYGAKGIKVCDRWIRFDYFLEDVVKLPGYDTEKIEKGKIVLDKDTINRNIKTYCPEACCFITRSENTKESALRRWNENKV